MTAAVLQVPYNNRLYPITPDIQLIAAIEDELGGLPQLLDQFTTHSWRVTDLVTLIHLFLQASNMTVDFRALGQAMIADGLDSYLAVSRAFLLHILRKRSVTAYRFRSRAA